MTLQAGHAASPRSSRGGRFARAGLLALGTACCAPDAVAAPMPVEVAEGIARIGPVINLGDTAALYAAAHAAQSTNDLRTAPDQAYDPDPRQRLDVFTEAAAAGARDRA